jgi:hypothetical protein
VGSKIEARRSKTPGRGAAIGEKRWKNLKNNEKKMEVAKNTARSKARGFCWLREAAEVLNRQFLLLASDMFQI